jgi:hypothetical protein
MLIMIIHDNLFTTHIFQHTTTDPKHTRRVLTKTGLVRNKTGFTGKQPSSLRAIFDKRE